MLDYDSLLIDSITRVGTWQSHNWNNCISLCHCRRVKHATI